MASGDDGRLSVVGVDISFVPKIGRVDENRSDETPRPVVDAPVKATVDGDTRGEDKGNEVEARSPPVDPVSWTVAPMVVVVVVVIGDDDPFRSNEVVEAFRFR